MSKYLPMGSLTVGYNYGGQRFFDVLNEFKNYIHSYYFSFICEWNGTKFSQSEAMMYKDIFRKCDTYGIPGNILLNLPGKDDHWRDIIEESLEFGKYINAVTCVNPSTAELVRKYYPGLQIHASVRITDALGYHGDALKPVIDGIFDVLNIAGIYDLNNHDLRNWCHAHGIKTKIILNKYCIPHQNENSISTVDNPCCAKAEGNSCCTHRCMEFVKDHPWVDITRVSLVKEMIPYLNDDIYKIGSRSLSYSNNSIRSILNYWTSDIPTKVIGVSNQVRITDDNRGIFYQWIRDRMSCDHDCASCMKCKAAYDKLI